MVIIVDVGTSTGEFKKENKEAFFLIPIGLSEGIASVSFGISQNNIYSRTEPLPTIRNSDVTNIMRTVTSELLVER
jgi:hypothetical protein